MEIAAEGLYNFGTVDYSLNLKFGSDAVQIVEPWDQHRFLPPAPRYMALADNDESPLVKSPRKALQIEGLGSGSGETFFFILDISPCSPLFIYYRVFNTCNDAANNKWTPNRRK